MIEVKNLQKSFKGVEVLKGINETIEKGEKVVIVGPSGSGKSTFLRCLNRLEEPTGGEIWFEGTNICDKKCDINRLRRKMGMVFQQFNLFAHLSVRENITLAPVRLKMMTQEEADKRAIGLLERIGLADKADAYPSQLSGGQQQRIAIARALATNPKILLCDEATSALDPKTTGSVLSLIKDINRKMGITVIVITHQMSVVEEICNKVSILDHGNVVEEGAVSEVFSHPKSEAAKRLVFPDGVADTLPIKEGEHHIRVVFNGADAANTPLIAKLAMETHIAANILGANTKSIEGKAYGNMLLGISGDENTLQQAIAYLQKIDDIIVEEVSAHVR